MTSDPYAYLAPLLVSENAFTPAELDVIVAHGEGLGLERSSIAYGDGHVGDNPMRICRQAWMPRDAASAWIYDRLERVARHLNAQVYHFELSGFSDLFQYSVYHGSEGGHFGWHIDQVRGAAHRKLSFSLQLSGPDEYQGGELVIHGGGQPATAPKTRGALVAFPSYTLHRVTPVTAGTRRALVFWTAGPPFR
ncbi:MAG: 2OG-Fe(II) oxygenase [Alphaproteobacteria bacterium]|nr:2OG-Fe(II) oxygenase [Alphaproteobacteria bacterium]